MARFSERQGFIKPRETLQINGMDDMLRTGLWNVLHLRLWSNSNLDTPLNLRAANSPTQAEILGETLWMHHFKESLKFAPRTTQALEQAIGQRFFRIPWHEVFDLIEFLLSIKLYKGDEIEADLNFILERERSGYRIVSHLVVPITDDNELTEIADAAASPFHAAAEHIQQAVQHYSNRPVPDYRNAVKESISAVESVARTLTKKDDLVPALAELEKKHQLHPVLKQGFIKLYSYTNGEDGIRHAMLDDKADVTEADARYMLVTCSAFVNYLVSRYGG